MLSRFSTSLVARISGATFRRLDHWARSGLLIPSTQEAAGKGSKRWYTFQDIVAASTIVKLRESQCPLQMIRAAIHKLRDAYPDLSASEALARAALLTDGERVYILTDEKQVMDVLSRQTVWAIPLGKLIIETSKLVKALPEDWVEHLIIGGRSVHLRISRQGEHDLYVATCREFPGVLERGISAEEAIRKGKNAVEAVLDYLAKKSAQFKDAAQLALG